MVFSLERNIWRHIPPPCNDFTFSVTVDASPPSLSRSQPPAGDWLVFTFYSFGDVAIVPRPNGCRTGYWFRRPTWEEFTSLDTHRRLLPVDARETDKTKSRVGDDISASGNTTLTVSQRCRNIKENKGEEENSSSSSRFSTLWRGRYIMHSLRRMSSCSIIKRRKLCCNMMWDAVLSLSLSPSVLIFSFRLDRFPLFDMPVESYRRLSHHFRPVVFHPKAAA